jgi:hypothetical protein
MGSRFTSGLAVALTILLVSGAVTPAVAYGPTTDLSADAEPTPRSPLLDDGPPPRATPDGDQPAPRMRVETAREVIDGLPTPGADFSNRKEAALDRLNDSLEYYRDDYRVTNHRKFLRDAHATSRLTRFADTDNATDLNVATRQLLWADRDTAALAIAEARRAVNRSEGYADDNRIRRARQAIDQAQRTFDRADRDIERALNEDRELERRVRSRSRAIKKYGRAWKRVQRAFRVLDRYVAP